MGPAWLMSSAGQCMLVNPPQVSITFHVMENWPCTFVRWSFLSIACLVVLFCQHHDSMINDAY